MILMPRRQITWKCLESRHLGTETSVMMATELCCTPNDDDDDDDDDDVDDGGGDNGTT